MKSSTGNKGKAKFQFTAPYIPNVTFLLQFGLAISNWVFVIYHSLIKLHVYISIVGISNTDIFAMLFMTYTHIFKELSQMSILAIHEATLQLVQIEWHLSDCVC